MGLGFGFLSRIIVLGQHAEVYKHVTFWQQKLVSRIKTINSPGKINCCLCWM